MAKTIEQKKIGHEYIQFNESLITATMLKEFEDQMSKMYEEKKMLRQAHSKMHGCVKAAFIVEDSLPSHLKVGVFKEAKTYHAWVRFSNGNTKPQHDKKKDIRGVAIKLLGVAGEKILNDEYALSTQDFLFISSEVFFSKNLQEFSELITAVTTGNLLKKLAYFGNPLHWPALSRVKATMIRCENPLTIPYWSSQPHQFGSQDQAVKYHLMPSSGNTINEDAREFNFLRVNMAQTLHSNEASFDFYVQFQTDADTMPIEDPTIRWTSQYIKLATLRIYPQTFDSNKQLTFADNLSFNPWHSLPEHRPLGSFNRIRKRIYEAMSTYRHKANGLPIHEPEDSVDFFANMIKPKREKTKDQAVPTKRILKTSAEVIIDCDKEKAFQFISSVSKLSGWLKKAGPIYGVTNVEMIKGDWSKVGDARRVERGDGATLVEELISYHPHANYAYQTTQFSDIFRFLTRKTYGQCWFDTVNDRTRVKWVYIFTYKNVFARLFLTLFIPIFLKRYLQNGLNNAKEYLEN
jgi:hypothetical protein